MRLVETFVSRRHLRITTHSSAWHSVNSSTLIDLSAQIYTTRTALNFHYFLIVYLRCAYGYFSQDQESKQAVSQNPGFSWN